MARLWARTGMRRFDSPDGRSLGVVIPCVGRGFKGRVISLVSVYGFVSGAGFDKERRDMFESLSNLLGQLPFDRYGLWVGTLMRRLDLRGSVRKVHLVLLPTGVGQGQGIRWWSGHRGKGCVFFFLIHRKGAGIRGSTQRVSEDIRLIISFVGKGIIVFSVLRRSCLRIL